MLVPALFVGVIVLLAVQYGPAVSVFGSIATALIFAYFLFPPLHSLRVQNTMERSAIAWMILAGVALPFLLIPPSSPEQGQK
jgi:K+-sensing histidine kinase KdpD